MLKLTKDAGAGPGILSIEGLLAFSDLDCTPRYDEPVPLEADMHIVLLDSRQVKDGRYR